MKTIIFNRLVKYRKPKDILNMYLDSRIWLTDKQLQKVIDLKNGVEQ